MKCDECQINLLQVADRDVCTSVSSSDQPLTFCSRECMRQFFNKGKEVPNTPIAKEERAVKKTWHGKQAKAWHEQKQICIHDPKLFNETIFLFEKEAVSLALWMLERCHNNPVGCCNCGRRTHECDETESIICSNWTPMERTTNEL